MEEFSAYFDYYTLEVIIEFPSGGFHAEISKNDKKVGFFVSKGFARMMSYWIVEYYAKRWIEKYGYK